MNPQIITYSMISQPPSHTRVRTHTKNPATLWTILLEDVYVSLLNVNKFSSPFLSHDCSLKIKSNKKSNIIHIIAALGEFSSL